MLGPGYLPDIYEAAICHELGLRGIAYERQPLIRVRYKDLPVGEGRLDLVVENLVIVQIRAAPALGTTHLAPLISYLKATGRVLGLLLNFGGPTMSTGIRRVVLKRDAEPGDAVRRT